MVIVWQCQNTVKLIACVCMSGPICMWAVRLGWAGLLWSCRCHASVLCISSHFRPCLRNAGKLAMNSASHGSFFSSLWFCRSVSCGFWQARGQRFSGLVSSWGKKVHFGSYGVTLSVFYVTSSRSIPIIQGVTGKIMHPLIISCLMFTLFSARFNRTVHLKYTIEVLTCTNLWT